MNGFNVAKSQYAEYVGYEHRLIEMDERIDECSARMASSGNSHDRDTFAMAKAMWMEEKSTLIQRFDGYLECTNILELDEQMELQAKKYMQHEALLREIYEEHGDVVASYSENQLCRMVVADAPSEDSELATVLKVYKADIPSLWTLPHGPERIMNVSVALFIIFGEKIDPIGFATENGCSRDDEFWYHHQD